MTAEPDLSDPRVGKTPSFLELEPRLYGLPPISGTINLSPMVDSLALLSSPSSEESKLTLSLLNFNFLL